MTDPNLQAIQLRWSLELGIKIDLDSVRFIPVTKERENERLLTASGLSPCRRCGVWVHGSQSVRHNDVTCSMRPKKTPTSARTAAVVTSGETDLTTVLGGASETAEQHEEMTEERAARSAGRSNRKRNYSGDARVVIALLNRARRLDCAADSARQHHFQHPVDSLPDPWHPHVTEDRRVARATSAPTESYERRP